MVGDRAATVLDVAAQPISADTPVAVASRHLAEVAEALGLAPTDVDLDRMATARPAWPVWPQPALDRLIGPPGQVLADIDLRWLHRFDALVALVDELSGRVGGPRGGPSATHLLVERAEMLGHHGWGATSAGTSCRLVRSRDGWLAVNLPREDDLAAVPALLDDPVVPSSDARSAGGHRGDRADDVWSALARLLPERTTAEVIERAELLGMPVAAVPEVWTADAQRRHRGTITGPAPMVVEPGPTATRDRPPHVVDLTSLWAGPLAGWYLARAGARVTKVESVRRPDGARHATPGFYRRLNGHKELLELELHTGAGAAALRELVASADIVIEASRPRAMAGFGIDPAAEVARGAVWCSITGYGRSGPFSNRIAFGDDAAAAGGLVTFVAERPWFIGDAAADPISGVTAAAGVLALWSSGRAGLVDVAMRDAVAHLTGGLPVVSRPPG